MWKEQISKSLSILNSKKNVIASYNDDHELIKNMQLSINEFIYNESIKINSDTNSMELLSGGDLTILRTQDSFT